MEQMEQPTMEQVAAIMEQREKEKAEIEELVKAFSGRVYEKYPKVGPQAHAINEFVLGLIQNFHDSALPQEIVTRVAIEHVIKVIELYQRLYGKDIFEAAQGFAAPKSGLILPGMGS